MTMPRKTRIVVLTLAVALGLANAAVFMRAQATKQTGGLVEQERWRQWHALSRPEQLEYARQYQSLRQRSDFDAILLNARKFAERTEGRKENLRELQRVQEEILERLPPPRRRDRLRDDPRQRAYFIFLELQTQAPLRLAELAARLGEAP